jgi:hypothetical protein
MGLRRELVGGGERGRISRSGARMREKFRWLGIPVLGFSPYSVVESASRPSLPSFKKLSNQGFPHPCH